jgi:hypothetical protein
MWMESSLHDSVGPIFRGELGRAEKKKQIIPGMQDIAICHLVGQQVAMVTMCPLPTRIKIYT